MKSEAIYLYTSFTTILKQKILYISILLGSVFSEIIELFLNEKFQFIAIIAVVTLDLIFGVWRALKDKVFETKKAFKSVWLLFAYSSLLAVMLLIEKGFGFASFLSEAVLLPILVFQIISIIKNMNLLGYISNGLLDKILNNIDTHKNPKKELNIDENKIER